MLAVLAVLSGCGGVSLGGGGNTGQLDDSVAVVTAPVKVLDLATGAITDLATIDASAAEFRDGKMAFRSVGSGSDRFFIGIFEVTQAQWQHLAGSTPWSALVGGEVPGAAIAPGMPAFNLSFVTVGTALTSYRTARGVSLAVPSDAQWTEACGGGASTWSWGSVAGTPAVLATRAVVRESQGATVGPRQVGGTVANGNGLHDLHGNVWEWTSPGEHVRGGSWYDPVYAARTANLVGEAADGDLDSTVAHALVGVRLVLQP